LEKAGVSLWNHEFFWSTRNAARGVGGETTDLSLYRHLRGSNGFKGAHENV
jgi:hypothetical protein